MAYTDTLGYTVDVGTMVGYEEEYDTTDTYGKSYIVVEFQTWDYMGDMAVITEITDLSYNKVTKEHTYRYVNKDQVIYVQTWKIGAI